MKEIELTQGKTAIVDDDDYEWLSKHKWYYNDGYAARRVFVGDGSSRSSIVLMHRLLLPPQPGLYSDHVNGNGLDNRRSNLRYATMAENNHNLRRHKDGSSRYKGVCWCPQRSAWRASICINRRQTHIGYFDNEEDAARQYNEKAMQHYGEFAKLNVIEQT